MGIDNLSPYRYNEYIKGLVEKYHDELVEDDLLSLLYKVMESL